MLCRSFTHLLHRAPQGYQPGSNTAACSTIVFFSPPTLFRLKPLKTLRYPPLNNVQWALIHDKLASWLGSMIGSRRRCCDNRSGFSTPRQSRFTQSVYTIAPGEITYHPNFVFRAQPFSSPWPCFIHRSQSCSQNFIALLLLHLARSSFSTPGSVCGRILIYSNHLVVELLDF